jgi:16S rRNA G966 N2-methylase RsmD
MKYAATFPAGTETLVLRLLKQYSLAQIRIEYQDDGLVVFTSSLSPRQLSELRYFTNVFMIISDFTKIASLEAMVPRAVAAMRVFSLDAAPLPSSRNFRLRTLESGTPQALSAEVQQQLIRAITRVTPLAYHAGKGDIDFWLMRRRNGYGMWALRLPRPRFKRLKRHAGQLRVELAYLLCVAAGVTSRDIVLDPFAGYGGIVQEAVAGFSPKKVIAVEKDVKLAQSLQTTMHEKTSVQVIAADALHLPLPDASVTRIVTDPPWGQFIPTDLSLPNLYATMLQEFARLLRPGGIAVVLVASPAELRQALPATLTEVASYSLLVSGKKATLIKLRC